MGINGIEKEWVKGMVPGIEGILEQSTAGAHVQDQIGSLERNVRQGDIRKASKEFEAYFMAYLMKVMRETVPKSSLTQNRMGDLFHSFYDEAVAKQAVEVGGIGLAQYIETRLQADQENIVELKEKK